MLRYVSTKWQICEIQMNQSTSDKTMMSRPCETAKHIAQGKMRSDKDSIVSDSVDCTLIPINRIHPRLFSICAACMHQGGNSNILSARVEIFRAACVVDDITI